MAIANRIARAIYKVLAGDSYKERGYGKGDPREQKIKSLVSQLKAMGVKIRHEYHEMIVSKNEQVVDNTGVFQS